MPRTYEEVLDKLYSTRRLGIDFGLTRVSDALEALNLKEGALTVVQVAGTNGKGSTARMIASCLENAGYKVGVFSSPHLTSLCERFSIQNTPVCQEQLVQAYQRIEQYIGSLTFFEQVTVLAAQIFKSEKVQVAIYEVGLGGRLDSTSAIQAQVGVITGIGLDHQEFLGESLEEIAGEKAGIFREGMKAVIGMSAPTSIRRFLAQKAQSNKAQVLVVGKKQVDWVPGQLEMLGKHQRCNAATAVGALQALQDVGLKISRQNIKQGLATASVPGRLQKIAEGLWTDGAHNPQAAKALADTLRAQGDKNITFVVGLSKPKVIESFLAPLLLNCFSVVTTEADNERSYSASSIAKVAIGMGADNVVQEKTILGAVALAQKMNPNGLVIVTGSLLLIGNLYREMKRGMVDPLVVGDPGGA